MNTIIWVGLLFFSEVCLSQTVWDGKIDPGTEQDLPCSFYSDKTQRSIKYFLTEDHLKAKRREFGMSGLTMSDVTPVSNPVACQKIRDLMEEQEIMKKPVPKQILEITNWTPHFYKVGDFYMVVYQPERVAMVRMNVYVISSSFEYLGGATI